MSSLADYALRLTRVITSKLVRFVTGCIVMQWTYLKLKSRYRKLITLFIRHVVCTVLQYGKYE